MTRETGVEGMLKRSKCASVGCILKWLLTTLTASKQGVERSEDQAVSAAGPEVDTQDHPHCTLPATHQTPLPTSVHVRTFSNKKLLKLHLFPVRYLESTPIHRDRI